MKIRFLKSVAFGDVQKLGNLKGKQFNAGTTVSGIPDELGADFIAAGEAEEVPEEISEMVDTPVTQDDLVDVPVTVDQEDLMKEEEE